MLELLDQAFQAAPSYEKASEHITFFVLESA
jgi:hypothetical protein